MTKAIAIFLAAGCLAVGTAAAQQMPAPPTAPSIDPRLAQPAIDALQGWLTFRQAETKACYEDKSTVEAGYEMRLATVMGWLVEAQKQLQARVEATPQR